MTTHLDAIPAVASAIALIIAPIAGVVWRRIRRRASRRNAAGCCAHCGLAWSDIGVAVQQFFVDGARACAPCARRLRRRTIVEYATLAATTAFVSGLTYSAVVKSWRWTPWWGLVWLVSTPILLAVATSLTVRRMKANNRNSMAGPGDDAMHPTAGETGGVLQSGESRKPRQPPFDRFAPARS